MSRIATFLQPFVHFVNNWISLTGVFLVTSAGLFWLFLLPTMITGGALSPYLGILTFFLLPVVFFAGLALIPLGIWWKRRSDVKHGRHPEEFPKLDFHNPVIRRLATFLVITTGLNLIIGTQLSYQAVEYTHSVQFCGQTCHTPMEPEFMSHHASPHSQIECAQCHIGPGAEAFVAAKLNGIHQLFAMVSNSYETPIAVPIKHLRPTEEICENCHARDRIHGETVKVFTSFAEDEKNTMTRTVMTLHLGEARPATGIHGAHLGDGVKIRYAADPTRQKVAWVERTDGKQVTRYLSDEPVQGPLVEREMDCLDCHNRPSHAFQLPDRALNTALMRGQVSRELPFFKKEAMALLKREYKNKDEASTAIESGLRSLYERKTAKGEVDRAVAVVTDIYKRNVFPAMKVNWGTYPNHIGHTDFPGCFRCHNEGQTAKGGKKIGQDCATCHSIAAMEENEPKVLSDLGFDPATAKQ